MRGNHRAGELCHYCGRKTLPYKSTMTHEERSRLATDDHMRPRHHGGLDDAENMVLSCERDNNLKATIPYPVFKVFADMVLKVYPELPVHILRNSLQSYLMHLLERACTNKKALRDASTIAMLKLKDETDAYSKSGHRKRKK